MTNPKYMRPGLDFARGKAIEELGELQAALGKSLRWGWDSVNPELPRAEQETNARWVRREIDDVRGALNNLEKEMDARIGGPNPTAPTNAEIEAKAREIYLSKYGHMGGRWECVETREPWLADARTALTPHQRETP